MRGKLDFPHHSHTKYERNLCLALFYDDFLVLPHQKNCD